MSRSLRRICHSIVLGVCGCLMLVCLWADQVFFVIFFSNFILFSISSLLNSCQWQKMDSFWMISIFAFVRSFCVFIREVFLALSGKMFDVSSITFLSSCFFFICCWGQFNFYFKTIHIHSTSFIAISTFNLPTWNQCRSFLKSTILFSFAPSVIIFFNKSLNRSLTMRSFMHFCPSFYYFRPHLSRNCGIWQHLSSSFHICSCVCFN